MASDAELDTAVRKACHATAGEVGGCYWPECKCAAPELLAALIAAARAEGMEAAAKVADASADACRQRKREASHPIDGALWGQQETAARTIAAAIRGCGHGG